MHPAQPQWAEFFTLNPFSFLHLKRRGKEGRGGEGRRGGEREGREKRGRKGRGGEGQGGERKGEEKRGTFLPKYSNFLLYIGSTSIHGTGSQWFQEERTRVGRKLVTEEAGLTEELFPAWKSSWGPHAFSCSYGMSACLAPGILSSQGPRLTTSLLTEFTVMGD